MAEGAPPEPPSNASLGGEVFEDPATGKMMVRRKVKRMVPAAAEGRPSKKSHLHKAIES